MPKKLNFLGGQQNYDPKNGEYLPDLTNKDGETGLFIKWAKDYDDAINISQDSEFLDIVKKAKETFFNKYPDVKEILANGKIDYNAKRMGK